MKKEINVVYEYEGDIEFALDTAVRTMVTYHCGLGRGLYSHGGGIVRDSFYAFVHPDRKTEMEMLRGFIPRDHFPNPDSDELLDCQFGGFNNLILGTSVAIPSSDTMNICWSKGPKGECDTCFSVTVRKKK